MHKQFRAPLSQTPRHAVKNTLPFTPASGEQSGPLAAEYELGQSAAIPVVIVTATRLLRDALPLLVEKFLNIQVAAWYSGLLDENTRFTLCDVALLDTRLGYDVTLKWLSYWRSADPPVPVIVMEMSNDPPVIVEYLRMGAAGYIVQDASADEVATAIRHVLGGTTHCAPNVVATMLATLQRTTEQPPDVAAELPLTPREIEVLRCLAGGMSNQEIGDALFIELCTVKHHVHNILEKLKLSRRWDAARLALSIGLTPQSSR